MSVQEVVDGVVEVLSRAESLFTAPADIATSDPGGAVTSATEASRAIGARTQQLGGALADAHGEMLAGVVKRLDHTGETDAQLFDHLARAAESHASAGSHATNLRLGAEEIPSRVGPLAELPASEVAALLTLRNHVADMQRLIAEHTSQAASTADDIRSLRYPS